MRPLVAFVTFLRGGERVDEGKPVTITSGMDDRSNAVPLRLSAPLEDLAPGGYACQVSILDPGNQKAAFWQTPIVVVPGHLAALVQTATCK